jgi:hypothetical protein
MMLYSLLAALALASHASADCSRASLLAATARYVAAQSKGSGLTGLTSNFTYTENDARVNLTQSILNLPLNISQSRSIHDTVACSSFTEIIAAGLAHQYVIGTRILYDAAAHSRNCTPLRAHTVESIVTKPGDWAFDATGYLRWNAIENWAPIPEGKRDSRAVIKAAGDAYFDRFDDVNVTVPFGTPCARLEGGAYTGARALGNDTCGLGLPGRLPTGGMWSTRSWGLWISSSAFPGWIGVLRIGLCRTAMCLGSREGRSGTSIPYRRASMLVVG